MGRPCRVRARVLHDLAEFLPARIAARGSGPSGRRRTVREHHEGRARRQSLGTALSARADIIGARADHERCECSLRYALNRNRLGVELAAQLAHATLDEPEGVASRHGLGSLRAARLLAALTTHLRGEVLRL